MRASVSLVIVSPSITVTKTQLKTPITSFPKHMTTGGVRQLNKLKVVLWANHFWLCLRLLPALPEDPRRQAGSRQAGGQRGRLTITQMTGDGCGGKGRGGGSRAQGFKG